MSFELKDILPEEISDETASHLADIFMNLALAIESHYLAQIKRYHDKNTSRDLCLPKCLQSKNDIDEQS